MSIGIENILHSANRLSGDSACCETRILSPPRIRFWIRGIGEGLTCLFVDLGGSLVEERRAFLVCGRSSPPSEVSARHGWNRNGDCHDEQESHDDEGEDPLESNDLALELGDTNCRGEDAESEANGVVLDEFISI